MESIPLRKKILETIVSKSTLKQKVFDNTFATFNDLKETLLEMASEMDDQLDGLLDRRVRLEYRDRGKFEAQIQVANDLLIFQMHTDVFEFGSDHLIWQNPYVQADRDNSYCGLINIYNFLSDSFKFNRNADETRRSSLPSSSSSSSEAISSSVSFSSLKAEKVLSKIRCLSVDLRMIVSRILLLSGVVSMLYRVFYFMRIWRLEYRDRGKFEAQLQVADDILIFSMHSNVFEFNREHIIWQNSYVRDNKANSYCGMINIYNFLSDSFKFNRNADEGYLIGRIFINREKCYFVEGKQQTSMRPMQFGKAEIDSEALVRILESAIYYALNFDLLLPSYDDNKRVTVDQFNTKLDNSKFVTGKQSRIGFSVGCAGTPIPPITT